MHQKRLGDMASYVNGYAFKPEQRGKVGLPIIRIQDLTGNVYDLGFYDGDYPKKVEINDGDVLISWSASLGVYEWNRGKALLNQHIFKVVFDKLTVDKKFFMYAVKYKLEEMESKAHGATMKHITKKDFDNTVISFPTIVEQERISNTLNKLHTIIDSKKFQLEKLDNLIKARFVEMVGDFDLAPQCNEWIKLSKLGEIVSGSTPKTGTAEYWDGDICWITPAELNSMSGIVYDSKKKITEAGRNSCSLRLMPINTVILSSRAPIGKVAILGKEMCCNQGFKNIICNEKILPKYLYYLLAYNTDYLNSLGRGATFKEISKKIVEDIRISLPSIEQQAKFITFSEQVDKSKFALQNNIISLMNLWYNINQYVCERTYGEA